jgi:hypothetical protein
MRIHATPLIIKTPAYASTEKWGQTGRSDIEGTGGWVDILIICTDDEDRASLVHGGLCEIPVIGNDRRGRGYRGEGGRGDRRPPFVVVSLWGISRGMGQGSISGGDASPISS